MKIVVDVFGGDNAPDEIVKGIVLAINAQKDFEVVAVGNQEIMQTAFSKFDYDKSRVEFLHTTEVISNDDVPTEAIRRKKDSSIVRGLNYLSANEDVKGFVSAGSTGAVLAGGIFLCKRIKGISRPALCPVLPTVDGKQVLLLDCGANVECKPEYLYQFAIMGNAYCKAVLGIQNPRIGLLSNGTEAKKGTETNKLAYSLLLENKELNFIGNIEAREILSGNIDVVVADGFSGNIALKGLEGTALSMFSLIKDGIMNGGVRAKIGYLLLKPVFKSIKKTMDYNESGGAVLLGLSKVIVKSHGSSKAKAICASVLQAKSLVESNVVDKISEFFQA